MSADAWEDIGPYPSIMPRSALRRSRPIIVLILGAAIMALSGGGLAGYLDLSTATAAPAPPADAPPLG